MKQDEHTGHDTHGAQRGYYWIFVVFLAIAAFYLLTEHRAHLFGALPFLLLLACPFMHLFMHHGHGTHGGHDEKSEGGEK